MNTDRFRKWLNSLPVHVGLLGLCVLWIVPTLGLLVTSFRPFQDVGRTGWWNFLSPPPGKANYQTFCAECHGADGRAIATADLTKPDLVNKYKRSLSLLALLKQDIDGKPHMAGKPAPSDQI